MEILGKVPDRYLGLLVDEDEREINYMSIWLCCEIVKIELPSKSKGWFWGKGHKDYWYLTCCFDCSTGRNYAMGYTVKTKTFDCRFGVDFMGKLGDFPDEAKRIDDKVDKIKRMIKKETIHEFAPL
jgi:hypothetical protein